MILSVDARDEKRYWMWGCLWGIQEGGEEDTGSSFVTKHLI